MHSELLGYWWAGKPSTTGSIICLQISLQSCHEPSNAVGSKNLVEMLKNDFLCIFLGASASIVSV